MFMLSWRKKQEDGNLCIYENRDKPLVPPEDFPRFCLGKESRFGDLARSLLWKHTLSHGPAWKTWLKGPDGFPAYPELPSGPKATLWDGWLCESDLWPAVDTDGTAQRMRDLWKEALLNRCLDDEGNVETDQGLYYAHPYGWPFPNWQQGAGVGWHFTYHGQAGELGTPNGLAYRPRTCARWEEFTAYGLSSPQQGQYGLAFTVTEDHPYFETPTFSLEAQQGPFLQLRWSGTGFSGNPQVMFLGEGDTVFQEENAMYCPPLPQTFSHEADAFPLLPLYRLPSYQGKIVKFRIYPGKAEPGAKLCLTGFCTLYDTRHNVNNPQYLRGCCDYFAWTQDLDFLRKNLPKMRKALRAYRSAHHLVEYGVVYTTWVGHEGRTGLWFDEQGEKHIQPGFSLSNNWLDLLPCGGLDTYATVFYYQALVRMAELEQAAALHPQWNLPEQFDAENYELLAKEAERVKETANQLLWNEKTGRFVVSIDKDGTAWDVGCTLINLEAVAGGLASPEHALSILDWISGKRIVPDDTSTGSDIYAFQFAPRVTTRRNLGYWYWGWSNPEKIPFGQQIQDGGAALAFSYFDLLSRIRVYGSEDAWNRMKEILCWFEQVEQEGGYFPYYQKRGMALQGGGAAGGIGITSEFFESVLPMQALLKGFLGLAVKPDGMLISPCLPDTLDRISVDRIRWGEATLSITAEKETVRILVQGRLPGSIYCKKGWALSIEENNKHST